MFSSNQPAAKCMHKGQQLGSKKSSTKWGYKQHLEATGVILPPTDTTTQHVKKTHTEADMNSEIAYIKLYMGHHCEYYKPMPLIASDNSCTSKQDLATWISNIDAKLDLLVDSQTQQRLDITGQTPLYITAPPLPPLSITLSAPLSHLVPALSSVVALVPAPVSTPISDAVSVTSTASNTTSQPFSESTPDPEYVPDDGNTPRMKTLCIWAGTEHEKVLVFNQKKVPTPPSISFHKNLDELGRLWSKGNLGFDKKDCVVKIKNHGIAYQHWPIVFKHKVKHSEDQQWKKLRKSWDVWQVIGVYYTQQGKEKFWKEFLVDSKHMGQTRIAEILRARSPNSKKGQAHHSDSGSDA
uniref:Uncharacterized protein n=1 Tax=Moniliophthora roreri TaxID=221103 RepID=A0A0W0GCQ4_MONRR